MVPRSAAGVVFESVIDELETVGFDRADLHHVTVMVQSQETVDRDYGSSWFNALR